MISINDKLVYLTFILSTYYYIYTFHLREYFDENSMADNLITNMNKEESKHLSNFNNESKLFGEFCSKIKVFSNNFDMKSRHKNLKYKLHQAELEKKRNIVKKLIIDIMDIQKKIYYDQEGIDHIQNFKHFQNDTFEKQAVVINRAYENIKNRYENLIDIKINDGS